MFITRSHKPDCFPPSHPSVALQGSPILCAVLSLSPHACTLPSLIPTVSTLPSKAIKNPTKAARGETHCTVHLLISLTNFPWKVPSPALCITHVLSHTTKSPGSRHSTLSTFPGRLAYFINTSIIGPASDAGTSLNEPSGCWCSRWCTWLARYRFVRPLPSCRCTSLCRPNG